MESKKMGNTIRQMPQNSPPKEWVNAIGTQGVTQPAAWTQTQNGVGERWTRTDTSLPAWLGERAAREAYLESCLEQDVAWQIRLNREAREMSQKQLGDLVGTRQSSIARAEDPAYGKHSLSMLVKLAHAFGCALLVRFVSYQELIKQTKDTSVEALTVPPNE
jgi:ribosome-binding protein aMBF1 (putative translation factor)